MPISELYNKVCVLGVIEIGSTFNAIVEKKFSIFLILGLEFLIFWG
jgi:hypothetical protein